MVELSHMAFPAQKNKVEDGTAFLPSNPSCRAVRLNFFEIAMKNRRRRKTVSHSDSAFHSRNNHTCGFSAKNVRTSSKNCRKKVKSHSVGEIAPSQTTDGGRHGRRGQGRNAVSPAFLLAFFGIFVTNAKGARGEKTRARSRTRGFSPAISFSSQTQSQCSKRPTSASI